MRVGLVGLMLVGCGGWEAAEMATPAQEAEGSEMTPRELQRLRAMGYLSGSGAEVERPAAPAKAPSGVANAHRLLSAEDRARNAERKAARFGDAADEEVEMLTTLGYVGEVGADLEGWEESTVSSKEAAKAKKGRDVGGRKDRAAPVAPLRAGSTDDNADLGAFTTFLGRWTDRRGMSERFQRVSVEDRMMISVEGTLGRPVPGAQVVLERGGRVVHRAETTGDGLTHLLPHAVEGEGPWSLEVTHPGGRIHRSTLSSLEDQVVELNGPDPAATVPLDVAIILDTTGSMGDELDRIKATLDSVIDRVEQLGADVRVGAVLYRDKGDAYVTSVVPMGEGTESVRGPLRLATAGGGGDGPEALNEGLQDGVNELAWRDVSAKVAFLIADAPPHMDYGHTPYGTVALDALGKGIRVHTVAASGLDEAGTVVFRQIAQITRGQFVFIEYGGDVVASAKSHGVASAVQTRSNNLDAILFERIRAEVDGWAR